MRIFICLLVLTCNGCMHTQDGFDSKSYYIKFKKGHQCYNLEDCQIDVEQGHSEIIKLGLDKCLHVVFNKVKGGTSRFLGIKISETNGFTEDRLKLTRNGVEIGSFSIEEIDKWEIVVLDDIKVYLN